MNLLIQAGMVLAAAVAGMGMAVQAGVNAQLARVLGHPLWATLVSLVISVAVTAPVLLALRAPMPSMAAAGGAPASVWLGGLFGAFFLAVAVLVAPRLGAAGFMAAVVAGQMLASLLLDHYALAGFALRPINLWRAGGALLVVAGVVVLQLAPRD